MFLSHFDSVPESSTIFRGHVLRMSWLPKNLKNSFCGKKKEEMAIAFHSSVGACVDCVAS